MTPGRGVNLHWLVRHAQMYHTFVSDESTFVHNEGSQQWQLCKLYQAYISQRLTING